MPHLGNGYLQAGMYQDIAYVLQGGAPYTFMAQSPDTAVFDLDVFDENANKVETSPVVGALAACQLTPMWTGPFTVRVICRQGAGRFALVSQP